MDNFVSLDPGMMIWVWVTFGILLFLLSKFAWKPILNAIESRETYVRDTLEKANSANEEAHALLEKHQEMIANTESEAQKMLKENRELVEKTREELLAQAREDADDLLVRAKKEIENQKIAAKNEIRDLVADLSIGIAEKLISENLDSAKHQKLIDSYIDEMSKKN